VRGPMKILTCSFLSCAFIALACDESDPCGAGMQSSNGTCVPDNAGGGGASAGSAGTAAGGDASGSGGAGAGGAGSGDFGAACSMHSECTGDTNYCAVQPGNPGYCTVSGCDADMSLCPSGWTCFNVGQFAPGEPWVCIHS